MFHTLKKWFGKEEDLHDEHLETFNQLVHKDLAPQVVKSVGSDVLPFSYSFWAKKIIIYLEHLRGAKWMVRGAH